MTKGQAISFDDKRGYNFDGFFQLGWMDISIPFRKDHSTASAPTPDAATLISTLFFLLHGVPRIHFYDGDDCHELAKNFCQKYGLEKGLADLLEPWLQ